MNRKELNKVQSYLDEQISDSSSVSFDDVDVDPDYDPGQLSSSHNRSMPPMRGSLDSDEEYVSAPPESSSSYLQPPVNGIIFR